MANRFGVFAGAKVYGVNINTGICRFWPDLTLRDYISLPIGNPVMDNGIWWISGCPDGILVLLNDQTDTDAAPTITSDNLTQVKFLDFDGTTLFQSTMYSGDSEDMTMFDPGYPFTTLTVLGTLSHTVTREVT